MRKEVSWEEIQIGQEFFIGDGTLKRIKVSDTKYLCPEMGKDYRFTYSTSWFYGKFPIMVEIKVEDINKTYKDVTWDEIAVGQEFEYYIGLDVWLKRKKINDYSYLGNGNLLNNTYPKSFVDTVPMRVEVTKEPVSKLENKKEGEEMARIIEIKETNREVSLESLKVGQRFVWRSNPTCIGLKTSDNEFFIDRYEMVDGVLTCNEFERDTINPTGHGFDTWADVLPISSYSIEGDKVVVVVA